MEHVCLVCNHPDRSEIERKYLEGWRLIDIKREHPFFDSVAVLIEHAKATGIYEEAKRSRKINVKDVCEEIIRAGRVILDKNKIYPRDMLEAARILANLRGSDDIEEFWAVIKHKRASAKEPEKAEQIKHKKIQTSKMAEKLLKRIERRKGVRKGKVQKSPSKGNDGLSIFR